MVSLKKVWLKKLNVTFVVGTYYHNPIFFCYYYNTFLSLQMSEWDRFAAEEYELLVAEEGGSDAQDQM